LPNFLKNGQSVAEISRFFAFQDGGRRHIEFSKIQTFNVLSPVGAIIRHRAEFHQ